MFENVNNFSDKLNKFMNSEKTNLIELKRISLLIQDKGIDNFIKRRENYLNYILSNISNLEKIENDFFLQIENLRKESLNLSKKNQKIWFTRLFENNFNDLKILLKSLIVSQNPNDFILTDKIISELEKLRYGNYK